MKQILLILTLAMVFSGCEKDDVCSESTETTPRLIIDFYDFTNPTLTKSVTNLAIIKTGDTTPYAVYNGVSKIQVPLDIANDVSQYQFILNYGNTNTALVDPDNLQFTYTRENVYVSRACGYKTVFTLDATTPFVHTDAPGDDALWMRNITLLQPNINTENETHLKISL
ncbi:DUF6452 family protein [Flavobacterium lotistagni]|uniref:DUF6452 family protein n=1 Tax=Flavobacterium lotistagni TaxID=2709660 RepID=UPI001F196D5D|nr:DUF6452 family protein [Flavobacterium lotistagni]